MTVADDLRILVDEVYPETVANLNIMITQLNAQLTSTQNEIITINDGVLDAATIDHLERLEEIRVANGWQLVYTYGDYGILNLTDWVIWAYNGSPVSAVQLSDNRFRVYSIITPSSGSPVLCEPGSIERIVQSYAWGPGTGIPPVYSYTDVTLVTGGTPLPSGLSTVEFSEVIYSPTINWDSDPTLTLHQDNFLVGYDQLNAEIGIDGTYGLYAKEGQIELGISVQTKNLDAYESFITSYEPYAS